MDVFITRNASSDEIQIRIDGEIAVNGFEALSWLVAHGEKYSTREAIFACMTDKLRQLFFEAYAHNDS